MGVVSPLKPGMGREAGSVADFVTASLADFIAAAGRQPAGAVLVWVDDEGMPCISWYDMDRHGLAYMASALNRMAFDE